MKKLFLYTVLSALTIFCFSLGAAEWSSSGINYVGVSDEGLECSVKLSKPEESDNPSVIYRAKLGGKAIPFYIGGLATKWKVFRMVKIQSDGRIVSLASEGDPQLELVFENADQPSGYIFYLGGLTGPFKKIVCNDLQ